MFFFEPVSQSLVFSILQTYLDYEANYPKKIKVRVDFKKTSLDILRRYP